MRSAKLKLARLESLLLMACDGLRSSVDACEYGENILGRLLVKISVVIDSTAMGFAHA